MRCLTFLATCPSPISGSLLTAATHTGLVVYIGIVCTLKMHDCCVLGYFAKE
jgi:hypothetical protein